MPRSDFELRLILEEPLRLRTHKIEMKLAAMQMLEKKVWAQRS